MQITNIPTDVVFEARIKGVLRIHDRDSFPHISIIVKSLEYLGPGKFEKMKKELYDALEKKGLLEKAKNKQIIETPPPKRIGIIAPKESKAFEDIESVLRKIDEITIFKKPMRDYSPDGLIAELQDLSSDTERCDVIIITRGGGDLSIYNDPVFLTMVAKMDVPIISATGHAVDRTLLDELSARTENTPTSAAKYIEQLHYEFKKNIRDKQETKKYLAIGIVLGVAIPILLFILYLLVK